MKVMIKCGEDLNSALDWYVDMIEALEGEVIEVLEDAYTLDGFVIKNFWSDPDGRRAEINVLDVAEVYDDVRIGKTTCRSCGKIFITGKSCDCPTQDWIEFVPGSVFVENRGMEALIDAEFSDLLPNIK